MYSFSAIGSGVLMWCGYTLRQMLQFVEYYKEWSSREATGTANLSNSLAAHYKRILRGFILSSEEIQSVHPFERCPGAAAFRPAKGQRNDVQHETSANGQSWQFSFRSHQGRNRLLDFKWQSRPDRFTNRSKSAWYPIEARRQSGLSRFESVVWVFIEFTLSLLRT